ncbi:MAG: biopolymer transporter ExbD [Gammaproteobacteria bacterium]|nr:biopolymer transporter ExbD [Gammaproteobacteria bacterium]MBV9622162.1 biopolymer transporter ExbD [Gammaproteobacteria bacterium]
MAMSVGTSSGAVMCDINTTPLIDVMLVLLVTLIVSLPIMTHAVKLDMPNPNAQPPPPDTPPEVIDLEIDSDGTVVWNGNPVADLATLEGYFHNEAAKDPQPEIHLRPDRRARYDVVAKVLAAAQHNHMVKIGFVNVAQFGAG